MQNIFNLQARLPEDFFKTLRLLDHETEASARAEIERFCVLEDRGEAYIGLYGLRDQMMDNFVSGFADRAALFTANIPAGETLILGSMAATLPALCIVTGGAAGVAAMGALAAGSAATAFVRAARRNAAEKMAHITSAQIRTDIAQILERMERDEPEKLLRSRLLPRVFDCNPKLRVTLFKRAKRNNLLLSSGSDRTV